MTSTNMRAALQLCIYPPNVKPSIGPKVAHALQSCKVLSHKRVAYAVSQQRQAFSSMLAVTRPGSSSRIISYAARHTLHGSRSSSTSSRFPKNKAFVPYFTSVRPPKGGRSWRFLWILPVAGGAFLALAPPKPLLLPLVFSSPNLIPCRPQTTIPEESQLMIMSPDEEDRSLLSRIYAFLERILEPLFTARRFVHLFCIFMPVIISSPMLLVGEPSHKFQGDGWGAVWWYGQLTSALQRAGPTFIKLAQWAASRADLFPSELCNRMGNLHSNGKPHSIHHTRRVIERVFHRPFEDVFEEFNNNPIGVGAIAQVYRAKLRQDLLPPSYLNPRRARKSGTAALAPRFPDDPPPSVPSASVAIKILHPHVAKNISRDLSIMRFFANLISLAPGMHWISFPEEVEVFGKMMGEQIDLRHEAENLRIFEQNFSQRKAAVTFPRPLALFSSRDVLIEEYEHALPMSAFLKNGGGPYDKQIAELGLDAFLNMLLLDNFVHADLHPGNIMIKFYKPSTQFVLKNIFASLFNTEKPEYALQSNDEVDAVIERLHSLTSTTKEWQSELHDICEQGYLPEIVFIDTGLVTTLNEKNRRNFLELFRAIAEFDGYRAGKLMVERCRTPQLAVDPEIFALRMQHLILNVKRKTFSLGQIKISDVLTEVLRAVRQHHVKMEGDFVNTVISVLLLEGIGRQLNPDLDLFKSALPILRQLGRQMASQETMETMKELPRSDLGTYLKLWVWLEARQFASTAIVDFDALIRYDWLVPNV